jgi:very-short-patch-repair endonuclease
MSTPRAVGIVVGQAVEAGKLERAKELRREMTPAERLLWAKLRANRVGGARFRRQQVIAGLIADFYCHAASLVVEVDGPVHADQAEYDAERDRVLIERGVRVPRVTNAEVEQDIAGVLARIEQALKGVT